MAQGWLAGWLATGWDQTLPFFWSPSNLFAKSPSGWHVFRSEDFTEEPGMELWRGQGEADLAL